MATYHSLSILQHAPFKDMPPGLMGKGSGFVEPAVKMSRPQMVLIAEARIDAMRHWIGVDVKNPYHTHIEKMAWSGIVDAELQDLGTHGEPVRNPQQRLK